MSGLYDVVALGELLIDFTYGGRSAAGMRLFEQNPGGAPANVLCLLANMGKKTALIGKVGRDMHGDFLRETLMAKHIGVSGLMQDDSVFTTLAFVELAGGERKFSFARKPGADTRLTSAELDRTLLKNTKIFHFGSLSLTAEPSRTATLDALGAARDAGAVISYDPNYRAPLWDDSETAARRMRSVLGRVDMIKLSAEETALLTGSDEPDTAAGRLLDMGVQCAVVTLGKSGALVRVKGGAARAAAAPCAVVDTTGAGDAFWGGFL
ncbi:MAG: carbohydrate kinase, partial [Oscillospiraceae bacterium]|nr:carbohydrate kinase [Oscillospiraceae bacterium]